MPGTLLARQGSKSDATAPSPPPPDTLDASALSDPLESKPMMRYDVGNPPPGRNRMQSVVTPYMQGQRQPDRLLGSSVHFAPSKQEKLKEVETEQPAEAPSIASQLGVLYAASDMEVGSFGARVKGWGAAVGGTGITRPSVKNLARSVEKGASEGDRAAVAQRDTLAGTVMFNSPSEMLAGMEKLPGVLQEDGCKILRMKNRMGVAKLRDFLINVSLPSGLVVELQVHLSTVIDVKMTKGKERAPRSYDEQGNGDGSPLDPRGMVIGQKEMHTHDAYDFDRLLDAFSADLHQTVFKTMSAKPRLRRQLTRPAELIQTGNLDELPKAKSDKARALRVLGVSEGVKKLKAELDELMTGLMGEVWSEATSDPQEAEAAKALQAIKPISEDADQPLKKIADHYQHQPDWAEKVQRRAQAAQAALDAIRSGVSDDELPPMHEVANVLNSYARRFQKLMTDKGSGNPYGANHITTFVARMEALATTLKAT